MSAPVHLPLDAQAGLSFLPVACLAVRPGAPTCEQCAARCPTRALRVDDDGPHLQGDCLRCGRCAAVCPTGALRCDGFAHLNEPAPRTPLRVECQRVASSETRGALRVPCLGGITLSQLIEWVLQTAPHPVELVDRGACATCEAAAGDCPAQALLEEAWPLLSACGVPPNRMPVIQKERWVHPLLPFDHRAPGPALSRRGFFRRVSSEVGKPRPMASVPSGPRARLRAAAAPLPALDRRTSALEALAASLGVPLPAQALWQVAIGDHCTGCGLCASGCPTGALTIESGEHTAQWRFDAQRCVGCQRCAQACPAHALAVAPGGHAEVVTVHQRRVGQCVSCGADVLDMQEAPLRCVRCRQEADMARSLFFP